MAHHPYPARPAPATGRIERRMALHRIEKQADYVKYVLATPNELGLFYKDMLINDLAGRVL